MAAGLNDFFENGLGGYLVKKKGALPAIHSKTFVNGAPHPDDFDREIEFASSGWMGDYVFIHGFFEYYWWGLPTYPGYQVRMIGQQDKPPTSLEPSQLNFVRAIRSTFLKLAQSKSKVVVVGSIPNLGVNFVECMRKPTFLLGVDRVIRSCKGLPKATIMARTEAVNKVLGVEAARAGLTFVDPVKAFCPDGKQECLSRVRSTLLYSDDNHLNMMGSRILVDYIFKTIGEPAISKPSAVHTP